MMESERTPDPYAASRVSTNNTYGPAASRVSTNNTYGPAASRVSTNNTYIAGDSTSSECSPSSPRQPPAYGEEPPQYNQEDVLGEAKARERKTIFIRLLTSIFITVLVSLIVAAVVEKIHDNRGEVHHEAPTRSVEKITVASTQATSAAADAAEATAEETAEATAEATSTAEASSAPEATPPPLSTVDCASMARLAGATLVTSYQRTLTATNSAAATTATIGEPQVQGMAVYSFQGCLWTQASYRVGGREDLARVCTVACPAGKHDGRSAREEDVGDGDSARGGGREADG
ncbi:hypothetical protein CDD83_7728 [Cordyceps sp. RAO-2017]|nr:hypothetical protein CDD83_7728 [Cordyceps sp. RAO-2017]